MPREDTGMVSWRQKLPDAKSARETVRLLLIAAFCVTIKQQSYGLLAAVRVHMIRGVNGTFQEICGTRGTVSGTFQRCAINVLDEGCSTCF